MILQFRRSRHDLAAPIGGRIIVVKLWLRCVCPSQNVKQQQPRPPLHTHAHPWNSGHKSLGARRRSMDIGLTRGFCPTGQIMHAKSANPETVAHTDVMTQTVMNITMKAILTLSSSRLNDTTHHFTA